MGNYSWALRARNSNNIFSEFTLWSGGGVPHLFRTKAAASEYRAACCSSPKPVIIKIHHTIDPEDFYNDPKAD
jgi:hypothetical protein